jgi:hypothetical protein
MTWFDDDEGNDLPALSADEDSMLLNTVRIRIVKSKDSEYHTSLVKLSRGNSPWKQKKQPARSNFQQTERQYFSICQRIWYL